MQHKHKETPGFTSRYGVDRLVYYERFADVRVAIRREKEIKGWTRKKKVALFEGMNPKWENLAEGWGEVVPPPAWSLDSSGPKGGPEE